MAASYQQQVLSTTIPNENDEATTTAIFRLRDLDIICGSGKARPAHPGNKRFQVIVDRHYSMYSAAITKDEKTKVIGKVMDDILSPGSTRFLMEGSIIGSFSLVNARTRRRMISDRFNEIQITKAGMHIMFISQYILSARSDSKKKTKRITYMHTARPLCLILCTCLIMLMVMSHIPYCYLLSTCPSP